MASHKRSRETDVTVRMAEGVPLEAESFILRTFSSCARELPAAAEEWDVSGFIYETSTLSTPPFSAGCTAATAPCMVLLSSKKMTWRS